MGRFIRQFSLIRAEIKRLFSPACFAPSVMVLVVRWSLRCCRTEAKSKIWHAYLMQRCLNGEFLRACRVEAEIERV